MEDKDIIALYYARNEDAIRESSDKYGTYVKGISMSILKNISDAEECVNEYDEEGRLIKTEREDWVKTCTYGEYGSYVELLVMKTSGQTEKTEVTKDEYGNILRECYYTDEVLAIERVHEYNESHQKIKYLAYYDGELGACWIYEYENDLLATLYYYSNNELFGHTSYVYGEFGELIRQESRDLDGNLTSSIVWEYGPLS